MMMILFKICISVNLDIFKNYSALGTLAACCCTLLFSYGWNTTWLGEIGTLPLKVLKCILIPHQVVHLGLWKHCLLQILLIGSHVEPTRIKTKLIVIARLSKRRLQFAPQECLFVDISEEWVIDYVIEVICTATQSRFPILVEKLKHDIHEFIAIVDTIFTLIREYNARLSNL